VSHPSDEVSFYIPDEPDLDALGQLDPDRDWQVMRRGQRWVLQTYLRLRGAGYPVRLASQPPAAGTLVYHRKHQKILKKQLDGLHDVTLLGIRGDRKECYLAHFEVVQNGRWADEQQRFYIPYWPQPGLLPRDPGRGIKMRRITFKGFDLNLHPYFFSREWKAWLEDQDMEWVHHSIPHGPSESQGVGVDWHDYREIDAVLALRPPPRKLHDRRGHTEKPASKLFNAWHAGVPAILGPEYAYREVRRSDVDYLEATTPEEVRAAVLRLHREPDLYRAMVENGRRRAVEFGSDRILARWSDLLFRRIPHLAAARPGAGGSSLPHSLRIQLSILQRLLAGRPAR
jgi:glycosyltransferase involved in cell wall biosynthesis